MRILLAGGGGYIGSLLSEKLASKGHAVTVADLFWFGNHITNPAITILEKNIAALQEEDLSGYEQVIFLGGLSNDPMAEFDPFLNFFHNTTIPTCLAYRARRAGVRRFIFASSCSVYGLCNETWAHEDMHPRSLSPYGIAKLQAERGIEQLEDKSFSIIILRQGTVSGHSPRMRMDLIVNAMVASAMTKNCITVHNASIWRPIFSIHDAAEAFCTSVEADYSISGVFNVASENMTVGEVAHIVQEEMQRQKDLAVPIQTQMRQDYRNYRASLDRAKDILGFAPKHSVHDIVSDLIAHHDEYGDYNDERYYNIRVFEKIASTQLGKDFA